MSVTERYNLIIQAGKYSDQESHDIAKWLCGIRDFSDDTKIVERLETMIRAFINRKKLGIPVTTKQVEEEFNPFNQ
jgi:hypothetical protein